MGHLVKVSMVSKPSPGKNRQEQIEGFSAAILERLSPLRLATW